MADVLWKDLAALAEFEMDGVLDVGVVDVAELSAHAESGVEALGEEALAGRPERAVPRVRPVQDSVNRHRTRLSRFAADQEHQTTGEKQTFHGPGLAIA
jgi:hypothetical protein